MSSRVKGYKYVIGSDGKRHRVYPNQKGKSRVLTGRGGYYDSKFVKTARKWVPKGTFKTAGGLIGANLGAPALGASLGNLASKILGFGDYTVKRNSMISEGESPAKMHSTNSSCMIRHREYICDIKASSSPGAFNSNVFNIQPGLQESFPWLAPIASQYEQYDIKGMVYEFKSLYADTVVAGATSGAIGGIIMSTNYNAVAPDWTSKQQMENTEFTTSAKPSVSFYHPIECAPNQTTVKNLYVRNGPPPENADLRMYDMGKFQIATFGLPQDAIAGELWCTYEIEFYKPVAQSYGGSMVLSDYITCTGISSSVTPFGTSQVFTEGSSLRGSIIGNNRYYFNSNAPPGYYLFTWSLFADAPDTFSSSDPTATGGAQVVAGTIRKMGNASNTAYPGVQWVVKLIDNTRGSALIPQTYLPLITTPVGGSAVLVVTQLDGELQF